MKSVPAHGWKVTHLRDEKREMNAPTLHLNLGSGLIPFHMVRYFFFFFLPRFQLFNECLHSACYCLKLSSKRQISLHSTTHYGANALCPQFLLFLTFSDSCRVHVRPICETLQVTRSRIQCLPLSESRVLLCLSCVLSSTLFFNLNFTLFLDLLVACIFFTQALRNKVRPWWVLSVSPAGI